jgi:PIN domain nuclease of toxin-antitoxin system
MLLLDTHVLHWYDFDDQRLGRRAGEAIDRAWAEGLAAVSAISFWELSMLMQRGRIDLAQSMHDWRIEILRTGLIELPLDGAVAIASIELDGLHKDPADRFVAATALIHAATLVTADEKLLAWQTPVVRIDARL